MLPEESSTLNYKILSHFTCIYWQKDDSAKWPMGIFNYFGNDKSTHTHKKQQKTIKHLSYKVKSIFLGIFVLLFSVFYLQN
jgi:hypothetical protein